MREDATIDMDAGPRVTKMYRLLVEYLAEAEGMPMSRVYQAALDGWIVDYDWSKADLTDYYGRRADDLDRAKHELAQRGARARRTARDADRGRTRELATA